MTEDQFIGGSRVSELAIVVTMCVVLMSLFVGALFSVNCLVSWAV